MAPPLEVEHSNYLFLLTVTVSFQGFLCASYALMRCDEVASTGPIFVHVVELFSARFVSMCSLVQKSRHRQYSNLHSPDIIHDELDCPVCLRALVLVEIHNPSTKLLN